jgi:mycothiol synthase
LNVKRRVFFFKKKLLNASHSFYCEEFEKEGSYMLRIRKFVTGKDEEVWIRISNEALKEFEDERAMTMEDMTLWEKSPRFSPEGMFIAEWKGEPAGLVNAYVDKKREEKKGFIRMLGVTPKFRRRGIGRKLAETAIKSLKERGMETVEVWATEQMKNGKKLFESMDFKLVRIFSEMKIKLDTIPSNIGESKEVTIRSMNKDMEEIKLLNWLNNETFKEHYDFRPSTVEETQYMIENNPEIDVNGWFFAYLKEKPVGYVGTGIDKKFIEEKGIKRGWIWVIGVLKSERNEGIGTRLILEAMKFLKSKGMSEAMLGVDDTNVTKAIRLYEKVGFKIAKKEFIYLKNVI